MFKNLSPQNKSFIILFCIAIIGTYLTVVIADNLAGGPPQKSINSKGYKASYYQPKEQVLGPSVASASDFNFPEYQIPDTARWKIYSNSEYKLNFKYPETWKVLNPKKNQEGFTVIEIDPGAKYFNIKIYISSQGFYALEGLPSKTEMIAGDQAVNVSNLLFGLQHKNTYYTFDNGQSTGLINEFNALVRSVEFR